MSVADKKKVAIVVGSGFGGLSSAFELLAKGYQVKVLEAGDQPGGRARVFQEKGYVFDAGPTVITAPYLFDELFELVGEKTEDWVEFVPVDPFYRIIYDDGSQFDYVGEQDRLLANIKELSPQDVDGYLKLEKHAKEIFDVGYTQLADQPFSSVASMLRVVPDMVRLQNYRSVYSLVSKYIKNEKLRQAFSFEPLLVGGNPFKITSIYLLIHWLERKWGVHFAKGGTGALVRGMVQALEKHGVEFHYNCPVDSLQVEKGRVSKVYSGKGTSFAADVVVSNTDPIKVYNEWIDEKWLKKHKPRRVTRKTQSMSLFVSYFGAKKKFDNLVHHTILLGPRYEGLLDDIFRKKRLADDFSLYLHAPTVTDPSLGPKDSETFYVLSPVPNNQSHIPWDEMKDQYQEKIFDALEKKLLPGLKENLEVSFSVTPNYFEKDLRSTHGSAFGIEPSFQQSAYFRFHNQSEDVKGLYFVGANTHPGAGVPGVINSAKVLKRVVPHSQDLSL
jgi:phytoene desaturase